MGRLIDALLRKATRTGMRRGLGGEHWAWLVIAGAAYMLQRARRPDERSEQIDLQPGDRYLVTVVPGAGRRGRSGGGRGSARGMTGAAEAADGPRPASE